MTMLSSGQREVTRDKSEGDQSLGRREWKPTEKGLAFMMENKMKKLTQMFRKLKARSDEISSMISENQTDSVPYVQTAYSEWLLMYEDYLRADEVYVNLLTLEEPDQIEDYVCTHKQPRDVFLKNLKVSVEKWFQAQSPSYISMRNGRTQSQKSVRSHATSKASSLSQARLREEQKQAEIEARMVAMKEKKQIELAKLKLRMQEEELVLKTQLAISDSKSKVIEKYERSEFGSYSEKYGKLNTKPVKQEPVEDHKTDILSKVCESQTVLNPNINPFVPNVNTGNIDNIVSSDSYTVNRGLYMNVNSGENVSAYESQYGLNAALQQSGVNASVQESDVKLGVSGQSKIVNSRDKPVFSFRESQKNTNGVQCDDQDGAIGSAHWTNNGQQVSGAVSHPFHTGNLYPQHAHVDSIPGGTDVTSAVIRHLRKPIFELKKFGGNAMEFRKFLRQFEAKVSVNTDSFDEKMNFLEQFTFGEANKVVSGFSHLDATDGFPAAIKELEDRYGDSDVIAHAFIKKALDWPVIRPDDSKHLDDFALFLVECENAVRSTEALKVLEYSENMKKLVAKLPFYLHDKWRSIVQNTKAQRKIVSFEQLVQFVKGESKKCNDPVYGKEALFTDHRFKGPKYNKTTVRNNNKGSFAVNQVDLKSPDDKCESNNGGNKDQGFKSPNVVRRCTYCDNLSHFLIACGKFQKLPYNERIDYLKQKTLCFGCLKPNHMKNKCRNKQMCDVCGKCHPTVLHTDDRGYLKGFVSPVAGKSDRNDGTVPKSLCSQTASNDNSCAMAIIPVRVKVKNKVHSVETYAFFDTGSSVSFCTDSLLRQLGVSGKKVRLALDTMGMPFEMTTQVVSGLQVCNLENGNSVDLPKIYSKEMLPVSRQHIPTQNEIDCWPHLSEIKMKQLNVEIGLMIGSNIPDAYTPFQVKTGPRGSPHATKTRLGWVVWNVVRNNGNVTNGTQASVVNRAEVRAISEVEESQRLDHLLRESIMFDFPERIIEDKRECSVEDLKFLDQANESLCMAEGHYSMNLPFRDRAVRLPNNETQGRQRLTSLKHRMMKNAQFRSDYTEFMGKILDKGYAERVPTEELERDDGHVWYIPHHGVYHPRKPSKIRVVFDCSSKYQGVSLNDQLLQGPDLANSLLGVLIRFRQEQIGIMGDIESMFFQVRVSEQDTDCLRFFWWPDGDVETEAVPYRMLVHLFGAVSSPTCANFALRRTVDDNEEAFDSTSLEAVRRNMYVDDLLASTATEEEASTLISTTSSLCKLGGFRLTKWLSNSCQVLESVSPDDRCTHVTQVDLDKGVIPCERALGVFWSVETDSFGFQIQAKNQPHTRRGVLSVVSSIYDPIGLAAPFVLSAKILLQELCRRNLNWDDNLTDKEAREWNTWLAEVPRLEGLRVSRCYKPPDFGVVKSCQIHNFCDASTLGYGIVSYLRLVNDKDEIHCSFVIGKARVAPLKKVTVPRLELTAAATAVRLDKIVQTELDYIVDSTVFWTDSMPVLRYIANEKTRFHTFVANRLALIRDATSTDQWRHIDTRLNPADRASRGSTVGKLLQNRQWLHGPDFLWKDESDWPDNDNMNTTLPLDDPEVKTVSTVCTALSQTENTMDTLLAYYSDWFRLKRATGWLLFALDNLRTRVSDRKALVKKAEAENNPQQRMRMIESELKRRQQTRLKAVRNKSESLSLPVTYLDKAESAIIKFVQLTNFPDEYKSLKRVSPNKKLKRSSKLRKLDPFMENGLLRVGGRLERAFLSYDAKHPIILPRNSTVSKLILEDIHRRVGHLGKNSILAVLRQRFWMISAAVTIKSLVHHCVICRRYQAPSLEQKMSDLPTSRLVPDDPPFTRTGMDYFGPFEVRCGRSTVKRYGVIFTCLNIRAVHLEVACSLDTDSCINSIRRFIARRGPVKSILSDNGTNLVGAEKELRQEIQKLNASQIGGFSAQKGISWDFNPPAASHFGGVWERLIRTVRKVLFSVTSEQVIKLNDEGLQTLLCEVESIVNGRPLTEVVSSPNDLEVLTPNHLLLLRPGEYFPPGCFSQTDNYTRRRWRQVQYLADVFWYRWVREYLPLLQKRQKWLSPRRNVTVGDIVLVVDSTPRNTWCLGRVTEVVKDKSGLIRSAKVRTKTSELLRPIAKLCLILEGDSS